MGKGCNPDRHLTSFHKRAKNLMLLLSAIAMVTLLASSASGQVVDGYVQLPDSFGIFPAPYRVAWDLTPGEERLFIGGDSSDVLVIDAVNLQKLARIPTGPVGSLCFSPAHNKLYASPRSGNSLYVVDCNTYQISKQVQLGEYPLGLFYNPIVDRVYCSTSHMKVLDCSSDSVIGSVSGVGTGPVILDSSRNRLYVGSKLAVNVVDCYSDSVVASVLRVPGARAFCYNDSSERVYAAASESLYAIDVTSDSVVDQSGWSPWLHTLCCDPARDRVYGASLLSVAAWDCAAHTFLWVRSFGPDSADGPKGLACVPDLDRVYVVLPLSVPSFEGNTGNLAGSASIDGRAAPPVYVNRLNRLYCFANWGQLAAIDCGIDTAMSQVPLDAFVDRSTDRVCLDTVQNKLYFAFNMPCGYVGAVDCSARLVKSYQMCGYPWSIVHDALDDKLYVGTWNGSDPNLGCVSVFDCRSDSLVKVIPTGYAKGGLRWHPQLNKVYSGVVDSLGYYHVVVIDCATDGVVRTLARDRQDEEFHYSLLSTESNQFWGISHHGYTVVDCLSDSIVMDTLIDDWYPMGVCCSESDRKIYVAHSSSELVVLSMESVRPTQRIQLTGEGHAVDAIIHVAAQGKVYVAVMNGPHDTDTVYVVDTETDSVVSRFDAGHIIRAMCDDATGRYVYCTALKDHGSYVWSETLLVIDTQCDSIVSGTSLSGTVLGGGEWLLPNRRTGLIYAGQDENGKLLVIRDSVVVGVEEWRGAIVAPAAQQTVINRAVPFRSAKQADLFDPSGRRAAILRSGSNDICRLAPGVYFVREEPQAADLKPKAVRKVVVTR